MLGLQATLARKRVKVERKVGKFMRRARVGAIELSRPSNHFLDQNNLILSLTLSIVFPSFHGRPMRRCGFGKTAPPIHFQSTKRLGCLGQNRASLFFLTMIPFPSPLPRLIVTDIRFRQIFIAPVETGPSKNFGKFWGNYDD